MNGCCHTWMRHVTRMIESCYTWIRHIAHIWVMSHINESFHTKFSVVAPEWVISHVNESRHTCMGHATCEWVMSHLHASCCTWRSHVTRKSWWCIGLIWRHIGDVGWQVGVRWCGVGLLWHEVRCTCLLMIDTGHSMWCASRVHVLCIREAYRWSRDISCPSLSSSSIRLFSSLPGNSRRQKGTIKLSLCAIIIWWQTGIIWV